jgi:hypothetical protein
MIFRTLAAALAGASCLVADATGAQSASSTGITAAHAVARA